jgi:hypothetical protein
VAAALALVAAATAGAAAEDTPVTVRVLSEGAKFIGSTMGGVRITLHDAATGEVLATGRTRGGTGDTERIMGPQPRGATRATADAAKFSATLDLDEPTRIRLVARGPLAQPQAANTVTETRWVLPGRGINGGDGWLIEMPGLVVDVMAPAAPAEAAPGEPVTVTANVALMCGCPIAPESPWPSDSFAVAASVSRDGEAVRTVPLTFAGTASRFSGEITLDEPGTYRIAVHAADERTGNAGVDFTTVTVEAR